MSGSDKADKTLGPIPVDLTEAELRDPFLLDMKLREFCRAYLQDRQPIPEELLAQLALRFINFFDDAVARGSGGKRDAHRAGRTVHVLHDVLGWPLKDAKREAAAAAGIDEDSAEKDYRRFLADTDALIAKRPTVPNRT